MRRAFLPGLLLLVSCSAPVGERDEALPFEQEAATLIPALLERHNVPGRASPSSWMGMCGSSKAME